MPGRPRIDAEIKKENIKKSIAKWRDNNREYYNEYARAKMLEWTALNREYYNKQKRDYHRFRKIAQTFRNILIDA